MIPQNAPSNTTQASANRLNLAEWVDRLFVPMLLVSLTLHLTVFAIERILPGWGAWAQALKPIQLIYEPEETADQSQSGNQQKRTPAEPEDVPKPASQPLPEEEESGVDSHRPKMISADVDDLITSSVDSGMVASSLPVATAVSDTTWASAVDLTNLASAAQGDALLYTFYSAIREQIQRIANGRPWLPEGATLSGTVYVGFIVDRGGTIQSTAVVTDRSVNATALQRAALDIVQASAPLPAFPPSFKEASKAIVVPIEFALAE